MSIQSQVELAKHWRERLELGQDDSSAVVDSYNLMKQSQTP